MDYPLLNAFWTIMWVFLWILWFMLLFRILGDIFRDDGMGGWGKAGWTAFVVLLPFLGCFVYLIARGKDMGMREMQRARIHEREFQEYIRATTAATGQPAASTGHADELARLADLKDRGAITDEEYARAKEKVLAH